MRFVWAIFYICRKKTGGGKLRRKTLRHCTLATRRAMPEMKRCSRAQQEVTVLAAPIELIALLFVLSCEFTSSHNLAAAPHSRVNLTRANSYIVNRGKTLLLHLSYSRKRGALIPRRQRHMKSSGCLRLPAAASRRATTGLASVGVGGTVREITVKTQQRTRWLQFAQETLLRSKRR